MKGGALPKRKGKGPTPKAEDRHWHAKRQRARAAKSAHRTGTPTTGPGAGRRGAPAESERRGRPAGARRADGELAPELVTGRNPVLEALRAGVPGSTLYVSEARDDRVREAIQLAADRGVPLLEAGRGELDRLTDGAVHQGMALQVKPYRYAHPDDLLEGAAPLIVAVDGITDSRNLGAIVRSASAFGASGVVVPGRGRRRRVRWRAFRWRGRPT